MRSAIAPAMAPDVVALLPAIPITVAAMPDGAEPPGTASSAAAETAATVADHGCDTGLAGPPTAAPTIRPALSITAARVRVPPASTPR